MDAENAATVLSECALTGQTDVPLVVVPIADETKGTPEMGLSAEALVELAVYVRKNRPVHDMRRKLSEQAERGEIPDTNRPDEEVPELDAAQQVLYDRGECPFCFKPIRGWGKPRGDFAVDVIKTLEAHGTNPVTGHLVSCEHQGLRIGKPHAIRNIVQQTQPHVPGN